MIQGQSQLGWAGMPASSPARRFYAWGDGLILLCLSCTARHVCHWEQSWRHLQMERAYL